jgi:glutamyl-tRNA synthetase
LALRTALVEKLGLKPRLAFGPVRAAVTGSRVSPPLFESIELLGRQSTLARIAAALTELGEPEYAESGQTHGTGTMSRPGDVKP